MKTRITLEPETSEGSREDQIRILEAKLPGANAKSAAALSRQIAILRGDIEPGVYRHQSATGESEVRRKLKTKPPAPPREFLWQIRANLMDRVIDSTLNTSTSDRDLTLEELQRLAETTLTLTPEEIQACPEAKWTPEQLVRAVKDWIWDKQHPDELQKLRDSFQEDHPELALPVNTPGYWIAYLKAYPRVTVNAGPVLTPEELMDVESHRARAKAAREETRRVIYEKYPDRFLDGFKTCAEYDAHHPGTRITSQRRPEFSKFPHERWV